jgi:hypothetical protein
MATIEKRYVWKIPTADGLLKEPPPIGPYYDEDELNSFSRRSDAPNLIDYTIYGYATEDLAIDALARFSDKHTYCQGDAYVLQAEYVIGY